MSLPIEIPNLPQNKITVVTASDDDNDFNIFLKEHKIKNIPTIRNNKINKINHHADLSVLNYKHSSLYIDKSQKENFVKYLTIGYDVKIIESQVKSPYPDECFLNCVFLGDKIICNPATISEEIKTFCYENNIKFVSVNQGYTKCSVCVVNENALITDDESIYKSFENNQIDALLIKKGSVKLKGFNYGFIGGCTGLIDKNKLLFNGDINLHSDCNNILDFLTRYSIEPVIIKDKQLNDIGSIIPLCESADD